MKRIFLALMAALLVSTGMTACESEVPDAETAPASAAETETAAETKPVFVPEDFGGIDFMFFGVDPKSRQDWTVNTYSETIADGETGEVINDAIFKRNLTVEELYNISIKEMSTARENVGSEALKVILAGDDVYQVVNLSGGSAAALLNQPEALYDLHTISTLDLTHDWWDENSIETFTIGGKLYNVVGDMNMRCFFSSVVLMMNKHLIESHGLDSPFMLVREGKWTMDTMMSMAETVTNDMNGDGKIGLDDTAGFFGESITTHWGLNAMGVRTITNVDGSPRLTVNTEKAISGMEKYVRLLRSGESAIFASDISSQFAGENIWYSRMMPMLMNNQLLFYNHYLGSSLDLRSMESDFGIIPLPKYDEAQETYYTATHPQYVSFMTIPVTNAEPERTGKIMEAMNAYSTEYVVPAVYQTTLVGKVIRDEESEEMLDIIFANRVYDIGYLFNWGGLNGFFAGFASKNSTDFASAYAAIESKVQADINKYMEVNS